MVRRPLRRGLAAALLCLAGVRRAACQAAGPACASPYTSEWQAAELTHRLDRALTAVEEARELLRRDYGDFATKLFAVSLNHWESSDADPEAEEGPMAARAFLTKTARGSLRRRMLSAFVAAQSRDDPHEVSFVLSTGGHSAAAAHGNFAEESYTHVLGDFLCRPFGEMGVRFVARDRAMGAHGGCPSCFAMEAMYGADADVVLWDFGMTDSALATRDFFARQALLLEKEPVLLVAYNTKNARKGWLQYLRDLHEAGFAVGGYSAWGMWDYVAEGRFPAEDADEGALPFWLKGLQGYPKRLGDRKYNASVAEACAGRKSGAARWHPGFKEHRIVGLLLGNLLLEVLEEALDLYNDWVIQSGDEAVSEEDLAYGAAAAGAPARARLPGGGCEGSALCNLPFDGVTCLSPHSESTPRWGVKHLQPGAEGAAPPPPAAAGAGRRPLRRRRGRRRGGGGGLPLRRGGRHAGEGGVPAGRVVHAARGPGRVRGAAGGGRAVAAARAAAAGGRGGGAAAARRRGGALQRQVAAAALGNDRRGAGRQGGRARARLPRHLQPGAAQGRGRDGGRGGGARAPAEAARAARQAGRRGREARRRRVGDLAAPGGRERRAPRDGSPPGARRGLSCGRASPAPSRSEPPPVT